MTKAKTTDLVPADESEFSLLASEEGSVALADTLEGLGVGQFQLPQLRVPSGGSPAWTIDALEGERVDKEIEVVVAHVRGNQKKWFRVTMEESENNAPPDCVSTDAIKGWGVNDLDAPENAKASEHECGSCQWNQFGSNRAGEGRKGKDCSDYAIAYVLRMDCFLPDVLMVPATSLKAFQSYNIKLVGAGKAPWTVVTKLELVPTKFGAFTVGVIKPTYVRDLTDGEAKRMRPISETLKDYATKQLSRN